MLAVIRKYLVKNRDESIPGKIIGVKWGLFQKSDRETQLFWESTCYSIWESKISRRYLYGSTVWWSTHCIQKPVSKPSGLLSPSYERMYTYISNFEFSWEWSLGIGLNMLWYTLIKKKKKSTEGNNLCQRNKRLTVPWVFQTFPQS